MPSQVPSICLVLGALLFSTHGLAQHFPVKPLRLIAPFAVGGSADVRGRIFAQALSSQLGQPVLVDNQGGGGGVVGTSIAARAPRDGHTLITFSAVSLATAELMAGEKLPYDLDHDFEPVGLIANSPELLVVDGKLGINTVGDLVARARARPGQMNFASAGGATITRMAMELFKLEAGVNIEHVPYKGVAPAIADLLASRVQVAIADFSVLQSSVNSGALKALAVTSARRIALAPSVPTTAEAGLPRVLSDNYTVLMVTGGSPQPAIARLREATVAALNSPELIAQYARQGILPTPGTAEEVRRTVMEERARWTPIIRANNIRSD